MGVTREESITMLYPSFFVPEKRLHTFLKRFNFSCGGACGGLKPWILLEMELETGVSCLTPVLVSRRHSSTHWLLTTGPAPCGLPFNSCFEEVHLCIWTPGPIFKSLLFFFFFFWYYICAVFSVNLNLKSYKTDFCLVASIQPNAWCKYKIWTGS